MTDSHAHRPSPRGWWQQHPAFRRYLLREGTSLLIGLYALWLVAGLVSLAAGDEAFRDWRRLHGSPWVLGLHLAVLGAFIYHAVTWMALLPWTLPPVRPVRRGLPDRAVRRAAWAASGALSLALIATLGVAAR